MVGYARVAKPVACGVLCQKIITVFRVRAIVYMVSCAGHWCAISTAAIGVGVNWAAGAGIKRFQVLVGAGKRNGLGGKRFVYKLRVYHFTCGNNNGGVVVCCIGARCVAGVVLVKTAKIP